MKIENAANVPILMRLLEFANQPIGDVLASCLLDVKMIYGFSVGRNEITKLISDEDLHAGQQRALRDLYHKLLLIRDNIDYKIFEDVIFQEDTIEGIRLEAEANLGVKEFYE